MTKKQPPVKPGERTPYSGEYNIVGPRGGDTGKQVTSVQGHPMPPTPKPNQHYELQHPADNGAGGKGSK